MVATESGAVRVTGNNINLTDSLKTYVREKMGKVTGKYGGVIAHMDVHLVVEHNPAVGEQRHKAEVIAFAGKTILRSEVRAGDMYSAIDLVQERISRIVRKFKERKASARRTKEVSVKEEEEEDDDFDDVYGNTEALAGVPKVNEVVKRKVFPMPLQTVEEAVLCCEYIDHSFYVFRNAETNELAIVYKRNHGGYGLIEPENPDAIDES